MKVIKEAVKSILMVVVIGVLSYMIESLSPQGMGIAFHSIFFTSIILGLHKVIKQLEARIDKLEKKQKSGKQD